MCDAGKILQMVQQPILRQVPLQQHLKICKHRNSRVGCTQLSTSTDPKAFLVRPLCFLEVLWVISSASLLVAAYLQKRFLHL